MSLKEVDDIVQLELVGPGSQHRIARFRSALRLGCRDQTGIQRAVQNSWATYSPSRMMPLIASHGTPRPSREQLEHLFQTLTWPLVSTRWF